MFLMLGDLLNSWGISV